MGPIAYFFAIAANVLVLFAAVLGQAQSFGPYLKVDAGFNFVQDVDVRFGGMSGNLSVDQGYRVDGVLGYEFGRWVALELEGGYMDNEVDKLSLEGRHAEGDSSITQIPILANVVLRYENESDFVPYIGGGAGAVMSSLEISGEKDRSTDFAWQGKVGLIYKIDERAWLDVSYKLLVVPEQKYEFDLIGLRTDEIFNHFFGVSVIWKF